MDGCVASSSFRVYAGCRWGGADGCRGGRASGCLVVWSLKFWGSKGSRKTSVSGPTGQARAGGQGCYCQGSLDHPPPETSPPPLRSPVSGHCAGPLSLSLYALTVCSCPSMIHPLSVVSSFHVFFPYPCWTFAPSPLRSLPLCVTQRGLIERRSEGDRERVGPAKCTVVLYRHFPQAHG
jgi:hypothetical protein